MELGFAYEDATTTTVRKDIIDELIRHEIAVPDSEDKHSLDATTEACPKFVVDVFHAQSAAHNVEVTSCREQMRRRDMKHQQEIKERNSIPETLFSCPNSKPGTCHNSAFVSRVAMAKDDKESKCFSCR
ncbi:hypothetical protein DOTSEDRAFT_23908 [Dothistroma septosporum NZE10]|uniref:Uncharacterized protein n=1 Tax=Dothistroma septosporum (strain NZE10 / CBS 128990) TaxID=675120 RepID=N1PMY2_DOTSN|nr:hypothetical protein DOTSEDRAFT_23908 [Dothistroma septosporum NZE10]